MLNKSIIIIGGNRESENSPLDFILEYSKKNKVKIFYVTNKIHLKKPCENHKSFKDFLLKNKVEYVEKNNLKNIKFLKEYLKKNPESILLTTFCFFKINNEIIKLFERKIFNYHLGKIPEQVGASATFWYMMGRQKYTAITFHRITNELDAGEILYEKKFSMNNKNYSLSDLYKVVRKNEKIAIKQFLDMILYKKKLKIIKKLKQNKIYMPRLNTPIHGYINWNWDAEEISSFASVFDKPFIGASTFLSKKKIYLRNVSSHKSRIKFHPFQYGIIFNNDKKKIYVACKNGFIKAEIFNKKTKIDPSKIILGSRLYTDQSYLDNAKKIRSAHTGKGIKLKI
jgi:methionyl-tRNA formyltransferase